MLIFFVKNIVLQVFAILHSLCYKSRVISTNWNDVEFYTKSNAEKNLGIYIDSKRAFINEEILLLCPVVFVPENPNLNSLKNKELIFCEKMSRPPK